MNYRVVLACIRLASRQGFRILHFSVQRDHLHLLIEAADARALSSGARGLAVRTARRLNAHLGRKGNLWAVRYHTRALRTPTEVRNALVYVMMNIRKHSPEPCDGIDPCSSAPWFDGFSVPATGLPDEDLVPICRPRTWLASVGWRSRGLIHPGESPRTLL